MSTRLVVCPQCQGTGQIRQPTGGYFQCSKCGGSGRLIEQVTYKCSVCNGAFNIPRDPPLNVRCPHCNSRLSVWAPNTVNILERGTVPAPPPGSRWVAGAASGAILGGMIAFPEGAIVGAILGAILGAGADQPAMARED